MTERPRRESFSELSPRMPQLTGPLFHSPLRHGTSRLLAQPMRLFLPLDEISGHLRFHGLHFPPVDLMNRNLNPPWGSSSSNTDLWTHARPHPIEGTQ